MLTSYASLPCRPLLPLIKVIVDKIGEVVALVDSGASGSAIKFSAASKLGKMALRSGEGKYKLRGVDNKIVPVDSFCSLIIGWEGKKTKLSEVAVIKTSPFCLILGVDWIVSSKTNLVVRGGRLVLEGKGTDINKDEESKNIVDCKKCQELKKKKKRLKVRFADGVEEIPEKSLNVSDELIEMYEEESTPKRCRAGIAVKLIDSVSIPGDSVMFVAAKIQRKFTGNGAVKINRCSHPVKEWMVPSAVVQIKKGKLKVPIVNLQPGPLQFKRRDLITMINIDLEAEVTIETKKANSPIICTATAEESVPKPCPSWVQKLRLGDELSEEEKISLLAVIKRRWRCFPNKEGQIGKTDQAEHLIDTGDAQPVRSAPYRVSRYEREIIVDEVAKMMRAGMIRPS